MNHVGERMKLLQRIARHEGTCQDVGKHSKGGIKILANVPDHLSSYCKMAAGSGLGTRLNQARHICS